jgi:hypothetical protein
MHCAPVPRGNDDHTLKPTLEVADILECYGDRYQRHHAVPYEQRKAIQAIRQCRTVVLGGHVEQCDHCGAIDISYNSCRNRHCLSAKQ